MRELSLHILDLAQNSLRANASIIEILINENIEKDLLIIEIKDNGIGMDEAIVEKVTDPFFTTRTTRKVGLGLSLFAHAAEKCGGRFSICSKKGKGTTVCASFVYSHLDRTPLGSMADTLVTLIATHPNVDFIYRHFVKSRNFIFDTRKIKDILKEVPLNNPIVLDWVEKFIINNLGEISGGA